MPKYKRIVAINATTVNGKEYHKGDQIGEVVITDTEAKMLNENPTITGFMFEPIEEKTAFDLLKDKAKSLGINFPKSITEEKLLEKIKEAEKE